MQMMIGGEKCSYKSVQKYTRDQDKEGVSFND